MHSGSKNIYTICCIGAYSRYSPCHKLVPAYSTSHNTGTTFIVWFLNAPTGGQTLPGNKEKRGAAADSGVLKRGISTAACVGHNEYHMWIFSF